MIRFARRYLRCASRGQVGGAAGDYWNHLWRAGGHGAPNLKKLWRLVRQPPGFVVLGIFAFPNISHAWSTDVCA
jgi:hypothetical protein